MKLFNEHEFEHGLSTRFQRFQDLMRHRVREILLVSSLYDSYILAEDGSFYESLLNEYIGFGLTHMPGITRVSTGSEAVKRAIEPGRFDLIITSLRLGDMHAVDLCRRIKQVGVETPVVLLTYDTRELGDLVRSGGVSEFDKVFIWQGDFRIFLAIIKYIEDRANVRDDTELVGVQTIILIEDSVKFYSSYLPLIYTAVLEHTEALISEGVNSTHKLLRMRARPKIILCSMYEEAWSYFETYHDNILGVISDIEFPRQGAADAQAGFRFAEAVKRSHADIPVLLQSRDESNKKRAEELGADFLRKDSEFLLHELKQFMNDHFGFGDFVFMLRDGTRVAQAGDLKRLEDCLASVPDESIEYHGERNDFSTWLKARTEFLLAHRLRPVRVSDYTTTGAVRGYLVSSLREHRLEQLRGSIVDYDPDTFERSWSFARIGGGSLGGKARGLGFANSIVNAYDLDDAFDGVRVLVPPSVILGSDAFDQFLDHNSLLDFAISADDDVELIKRFVDADFPEMWTEALCSYLETVGDPLTVRSSSLLEDSQFMPFAGVYETLMLANNNADIGTRLADLLTAIKRVYASTFSRAAKRYLKATPYRLEEEKMAVIIQQLIGTEANGRFYPDFSGVAKSHNFYPIAPMTAEDGIALVALGLGKTVVEGGATVRFCPRFPRHIVHFSSVDEVLKYSQKQFFALSLPGTADGGSVESRMNVERFDVGVAEDDGMLASMGSTYSLENHAISDGISRPGGRLVTFSPILKYDVFPLPQILEKILSLGARGMNGAVEIEFAVRLSKQPACPHEFYILQMRPMVIDQEREGQGVLEARTEDMICRSSMVLGNGAIRNIHDVVVVDAHRFDRSRSVQVAAEIRAFNAELAEAGKLYLLIGVGRWGSADPWLGIPVRWEDIGGARVIVEAGLRDIKVAPSQGTHFFQNITSSKIGYITVDSREKNGFVDWEWLTDQPSAGEAEFTRHLRFDSPLLVVMDGQRREAVVLKPGMGPPHGG